LCYIAAEVLFKIQPAKDHPVDLYFVMDLSNSMKPYKENLVASATAIAETIQRYTESFRMGFGSFSDKPTAPFSGKKIT
jgi:integrin beta 1